MPVVGLDDGPHPIERSLLLLGGIQGLNIVEVEFMLALGAEMVEILDDPLPNALLVEDVSAGQQHTFSHVLIANSASQIMEIVELISFQLLEESHCLGQFLDPAIGVIGLLDISNDLEATEDSQKDELEL